MREGMSKTERRAGSQVISILSVTIETAPVMAANSELMVE